MKIEHEVTMAGYVEVTAGSGYGHRTAWYQLIEGRMVLLHGGNHDNLVGNGEVCEFEGMTLDQAKKYTRKLNDEPVGHDYDGCHACTWGIGVSVEEPPGWLVYQPPEILDRIRTAIRSVLDQRESPSK